MPGQPQERHAIHAYLSADSIKAWQVFAEENGVSVTGLLEAVGEELDLELKATGDATLVRQDWVKRGRKIDAVRRRRGRD